MSAPNVVNIGTLTLKTDTFSLSTTSATSVLNNASSSGKVLRVLLLRVVNIDGSDSVNATAGLFNQANAAGGSASGTQTMLIQLKAVAANTNLDIITRDTPVYLEEDTSLGVTASNANDLSVIVTYEEIS
jgi:hypothetical protein